MEENLIKLKEEIQEALISLEVIVCSIEWIVKNSYQFLRIELDKVSGIDLDKIVEATNIINPIVDSKSYLGENYILDVISKERGNKNG